MHGDLASLFSKYEYEICLVIGWVAILNFGYKQLKLPLPDGYYEERVPALKGGNVLNSAGHTLFFEAYVYFALSLTFLYSALCFSEGVYSFATSNPEAGSNPAPRFGSSSGVWPLTVATLIVGISAETPILKEVELFFRRFSRYSAGIYRNIVKSIDRLNEIRFHCLPETEYSNDLLAVGNIMAFGAANMGCSSTKVAKLRSLILRGFQLHNWSLSKDTSVTWKTTAKKNTENLLGNVSEAVDEVKVGLNSIIDDLKKTEAGGVNFADAFATAFPRGFEYEMKGSEASTQLWKRFEPKVNKGFEAALNSLDRLREVEGDLVTVFAILHTQDRFPNFDEGRDPALRVVLDHLASYSSQIIRNIIVRIVFFFTFLSAIISFLFISCRELSMGTAHVEEVLSAAIKVAWVQALGYGVGILTVLLFVVAFIRIFEEPLSNAIRRNRLFPVAYFPAVFIIGSILAILARMIVWSALKISDYSDWQLFRETLLSAAPIELIDSVVMGFVSVFFFVVILRLDDSSFKGLQAFKRMVIRQSLLLSLLAGLTIFIGHTIANNAPGMWSFERNSSLLYLVLATLVPLFSFWIMSGPLSLVAEDRHKGDCE